MKTREFDKRFDAGEDVSRHLDTNKAPARKQDDVQTQALKRMTPEQKLQAAMWLYWSARELKAAWIRSRHPDWTPEQVEQAVREIFANART
jgi:hypothetical protein